MPAMRNNKAHARFLRGISSGSITVRNGQYCNSELLEKGMEAQGAFKATATAMAQRSAITSDFEYMEMNRLPLHAQATPEATETALAHHWFVIFPVYQSR
jgi:hypothetical protein